MSKPKTERHKDAVREYYRIKNERDYEAIDEILADDFTATYCDGHGLKSQFDKELLVDAWSQGTDTDTQDSDVYYSIHEIIAEGDRAVAHLNYGGTHNWEMMGIEPTGKQTDTEQHLHFRFADGKIVEGFSTYNALNGIWRRIGAMPPIDFDKGSSGTHRLRENR